MIEKRGRSPQQRQKAEPVWLGGKEQVKEERVVSFSSLPSVSVNET